MILSGIIWLALVGWLAIFGPLYILRLIRRLSKVAHVHTSEGTRPPEESDYQGGAS